ncbi:major facilitator superfamily domain-containing protein [Kalaharituber pfeilii]|nr:major facilitator superfamily domain-containing protein [Kalaharituber pfeilii]
MDGYDFHTVSLSISRLAVFYGEHRETISTSITLTLLFRPVGAIIFGLAGDLYGRKWPMIANLVLIALLQLLTAYCNTFRDFLVVRAIFGIGMGGIWGNAASMGLENMPVDSRGFFSGILQQGYALGYLIAAVFNLFVVPASPHSFKSLFYIGAGLTLAVAIARLFFPESKQFLEQRERARQNPELQVSGTQKVKAFQKDLKKILKAHWKLCLYACVLMALFNSMSHTSQDLYPTYMQQTKGFTPEMASKATIIAKTGAIVGGAFAGYYSQFFGRRATIMVATMCGAALIPLWILPSSFGSLVAGSFLIQFCVQGAWGVIPIHLNELAPPQFRASFPGITYQVGNMISSPMAQIGSVISESWHIQVWIEDDDGGHWETRPDYARTMAAMMSVIFVFTCVWTACGSEAKGTRFELARVAGEEDIQDAKLKDVDNEEAGEDGGKGEVQFREAAPKA